MKFKKYDYDYTDFLIKSGKYVSASGKAGLYILNNKSMSCGQL